ncbi:acyl-CoA N-acyltransferase [Mycena floridula]|nr:acyl-CoA N-acyltransferase [Mycena floridula]
MSLTLLSPSGRVKLASPTEADDEPKALLRSHPATSRYLPTLPTRLTTSDARAMRERLDQDISSVALTIHFRDEVEEYVFAGTTGLYHIDKANNRCTVGIMVSPNIHGRGIATEALYTVMEFAFETRNFHKVTFETSMENVQMRGWLEKTAGARLEGVMKDAWKHFEADAYSDMASYGILEGEWRNGIKEKLKAKIQKVDS